MNKSSNKVSFNKSIIIKPAGADCNLGCEYCFYLKKGKLYPEVKKHRMSLEILEELVKQVMESSGRQVGFIWQGGEPTLMGVDFFYKIIELQMKYGKGQTVSNAFQTNGILINEDWAKLLQNYKFLIGLSIDGDAFLHNKFRKTAGGNPTFEKTWENMHILRRFNVDFNILACVTKHNAKRALDVYRFFKEHGVQYIQFIPIVETQANCAAKELGLRLALPSASGQENISPEVTEWSVEPSAYGDFLIKIFNQWIRTDVGSVFIMNFEWALSSWITGTSCVCTFFKNCGRCLVMEHNGDVYSCDHYVYPDYRLGNILETDLGQMVESEKQI